MNPTIEAQIDRARRRVLDPRAWLESFRLLLTRWPSTRNWWRKALGPAGSDRQCTPAPRRQLFLDDDPRRAEVFLRENPRAIWVKTVAECLACLEEPWHEVHLDHDLGGKKFVNSDAQDCGMEVIRWLCKEPRPHLKDARFLVHTHHAAAGLLMVLQMRSCDYRAEFRPFGLDLERLLAHNEHPDGESPANPR